MCTCGTGAVHRVQRARHAQVCLVETSHLSLGDALFDQLEELIQPVGGALGHRPHGALRDRGAEQLGQRARGALLGQELPDIQIQDDRGDPRPYCTGADTPSGALPQVVTPHAQRRAIS